MSKKYIANNFDLILSILVIFFSIILYVRTKMSGGSILYEVVTLLAVLSGIIWILIKDKVSFELDYIHFKEYRAMLPILFFLLFISSLLFFNSRSCIYVRPTEYFLCIALMTGIVSLEIILDDLSKRWLYLILVQIIIIGLCLVFSQSLIFPGLVGVDTWYHQYFTQQLLNIGKLPDSYAYSKLPIFSILIAITSQFISKCYQLSMLLSIGLLQVICDVLFVFMLGKLFFNERIGLLAGLAIVTANIHVRMGFWAIPNTIGTVMVTIILYILFFESHKRDIKDAIIILLFMMTLILTHTIASAGMTVILFTGLFSFIIYSYIHCFPLLSKRKPISIQIALYFLIAMTSWWIYVTGQFITLAQLIDAGFRKDTFSPPASLYIAIPSIYEEIFNQLAMFVFFSVSLIGIFYMLSKKGTQNSFVLSIICLTLIFLGVVPSALGHSLIEERWWYLAQIIISIPFAIALILSIGLIKNIFTRSIFLFSIITIISAFMIMSPIANLDNNLFHKADPLAPSLIVSELQFLTTFPKSAIITDKYYSTVAKYLGYDNSSTYSYGYDNSSTYSYGNDNTIKKVKYKLIVARMRTSANFPLHYIDNNYMKVYDNKMVYAFI